MERIIDRFDVYMSSVGLNDNKVTVQLKLSKGLIGKSRKPGRDLSSKIVSQILETYTDLNRVWFLTGEGSMLLEEKSSQETPAPEQATTNNSLIEYLQRKIAELESKVDKLTDEKTELLQENAILKYENMMLSPRKGDVDSVEGSSAASAV
jgi:hypothetical protein